MANKQKMEQNNNQETVNQKPAENNQQEKKVNEQEVKPNNDCDEYDYGYEQVKPQQEEKVKTGFFENLGRKMDCGARKAAPVVKKVLIGAGLLAAVGAVVYVKGKENQSSLPNLLPDGDSGSNQSNTVTASENSVETDSADSTVGSERVEDSDQDVVTVGTF